MSAPAFTPGPWDVESTRNPNADYITWREIKAEDSDGKSIVLAEVYMDSNLMEPTNEQARANARLLAAAPELFEALEKALPFIGSAAARSQIIVGVDAGELYFVIEAALAKARGE